MNHNDLRKILLLNRGTPPPIWLPTDIGDCVLDCLSDLDQVTKDGSDRVELWTDRALSNDPVQATDAKKYVWFAGSPAYLLSDNVDDYMECPDVASLQITGNFTGVFWVKNVTWADSALMAKWAGGAGYMIGYNGNARIYSDGSWMGLSTVITTETDTWLNMALVKNGIEALIYFNGISQEMAGGPLNATQSNAATPLNIGTYANAGGGRTTAKWGAMTLYSKALSQTQVSTYFNNTKARYGL